MDRPRRQDDRFHVIDGVGVGREAAIVLMALLMTAIFVSGASAIYRAVSYGYINWAGRQGERFPITRRDSPGTYWFCFLMVLAGTAIGAFGVYYFLIVLF